eukprot:461333_1
MAQAKQTKQMKRKKRHSEEDIDEKREEGKGGILELMKNNLVIWVKHHRQEIQPIKLGIDKKGRKRGPEARGHRVCSDTMIAHGIPNYRGSTGHSICIFMSGIGNECCRWSHQYTYQMMPTTNMATALFYERYKAFADGLDAEAKHDIMEDLMYSTFSRHQSYLKLFIGEEVTTTPIIQKRSFETLLKECTKRGTAKERNAVGEIMQIRVQTDDFEGMIVMKQRENAIIIPKREFFCGFYYSKDMKQYLECHDEFLCDIDIEIWTLDAAKNKSIPFTLML